MARNKKASTVAGNNCFCNILFLKNRPSPTGKYQLKLRLTINNQPIKGALVQKLDCPILYNNETVRLSEFEFDTESNRATAGFENGELRRFNLYLHQLMLRAVAIGDNIFKEKATLTHSLFRDLLYKDTVRIDTTKREQLLLKPDEYPFLTSPLVVDKEVLDNFNPEKIIDADSNLPVLAEDLESVLRWEQSNFDSIIHSEELKKMPSEDIYKNNLYKKNNIFELFGSIYYDSKVPATYHKIVIRLFEYRELKKPIEDIRFLNAGWLIDFFKFLKENGWYQINTSVFDPLKYKPDIFFQLKQKNDYKPKSLNKMIGIVKTLINGKDQFSFHKKGLLPKLDLSDLRLAAITDEKDEDGTRIEHNLNKEEFDYLYHYKFDKKKITEYQKIFNEQNKSESIIITIDDLTIAKQLFILQVMFGGLRGYVELSTCKIIKHNSKEHAVTFHQSKVKKTITNPLNVYTEAILKPLNYHIPQLIRHNVREKSKKVTNINLLEQHYRSLLQTIGHIINLDRQVLVDDKKFIHKKIKDIFNPYFSRKTFGTIMYTELRLNDSEIALFTGHIDKKNQTELSSSYVQKNTFENKKKLQAGLKINRIN